MNLFPQSPLYIIENKLDAFADELLGVDDFLESLSAQYERVGRWLDNLENQKVADFEEGQRMQAFGQEGSHLMMQALEQMYVATDEDDFEALDEAAERLSEAHQLIEYSFALADQIDAETEEIVADAISHQLA